MKEDGIPRVTSQRAGNLECVPGVVATRAEGPAVLHKKLRGLETFRLREHPRGRDECVAHHFKS